MTSVNGQNGRNPFDGLDAQGDEVSIHSFDQEVAAFAQEVHDLYVRPATTDLAERHVTAILAEARRVRTAQPDVVDEVEPARQPVLRPRWSLVRRLAVVALVTVVAGAGLALAGVRPLDRVRDALEQVGILSDDDGRQDGAAPNGGRQAQSASGHDNPSNDGETPGAKHSADAADEGQATAEQARSGETPPDTPGQSDDHPQPQGEPPADAGPPYQAPKGRPESPPGQSDFGPGYSSERRPAAPPGQADE